MSDQSAQLTEYLEAMLARTRGAAADVGQQPEPGTGVAAMRERAERIRAKLAELDGRTFNGLTEEEDEAERATREPRVLAEVDGRGTLLSIDINPYAMRDYDAAELAQACTDAIKAARLQASAHIEETFAELAPQVEDMPTAPDLSGMDVDEILRQAKEVAQRWTNPASRR